MGVGNLDFKMFRGAGRSRVIACTCVYMNTEVAGRDDDSAGGVGGGGNEGKIWRRLIGSHKSHRENEISPCDMIHTVWLVYVLTTRRISG
jgi:hypothetical protein